MKTAIIYASKYGTTEKIAVSIAEKLKEKSEVALFSLEKNRNPAISGFEMVILGTPIYAGQASRKMKTFCKTNEPVLLQKKTGLFVCGMYPDQENQDKELNNAYPETLQQKTIAAAFLGGAFIFEKMNFIERFIIKQIAKTATSVEHIDWKAIERFVDTLTIEK